MNHHKPQAPLSLKWLPVAWISLGFTTLVFMGFGMFAQGDPTPLIKSRFGDVPLFFQEVVVVAGVLEGERPECLNIRDP